MKKTINEMDVPKTEEKKLTDEMIIKALEYKKEHLLKEEKRTGNASDTQIVEMWGEGVFKILDLIHRLQAENEELKARQKCHFELLTEKNQKIVEQMVEIERLTEENAILKGNPPLIAGRSLGKTIRAKLLAFDQMKEQNAELQKQVDELKARDMSEMRDLFNNETDRLIEKAHQQGVKDTADEIYDFVKEYYTSDEDVFGERLKEFVKRYGVEVE